MYNCYRARGGNIHDGPDASIDEKMYHKPRLRIAREQGGSYYGQKKGHSNVLSKRTGKQKERPALRLRQRDKK